MKRFEKLIQIALPFATMAINVVAGACTHTVAIRSNPSEAEVLELGAENTAGNSIGKTPMTITSQKAEMKVVQLRKTGYLPATVFVPLTNTVRTDLDLFVRLVPEAERPKQEVFDPLLVTSFNEAADSILTLQALIIEDKKEEIDAWNARNAARFENVAVYHALLGNYHFIGKRGAEARKHYERALQLDPLNRDAKTMLETLAKPGATR